MEAKKSKLNTKKNNISNNYKIIYNQSKKKWQLSRRGMIVFSGTKEGVQNWMDRVVIPNNPIF
jgi:hypothetical protein